MEKDIKMSNNKFSWKDCYVGYLNLDHRKDRFIHINEQLPKLGLFYERTRGKLPHEYDLNDPKYSVMKNRTPGAICCHYGQVHIMEKAWEAKKSVIVFEDDVVLCEDIVDRLNYMQDFLNKQDDWDIMWLGATVHMNPAWWHTGTNSDLPDATLGVDAQRTEDPRILRTYGCFCTYAYIVRYHSIQKVLDLLESVVHLSMGIDWAMIKLQPQLKTFCMIPGSVKQIDNMSDIGKGMTVFSGFSRLGEYWYKERMNDFDPQSLIL